MRAEQIQAVLTIAETRSFRRAAVQLGVSQSSLSATVRRLEEELGVELLSRSREGARLADAGHAALDAMRALAVAADAVREAVEPFSGTAQAQLRIVTVTAAMNTVLPTALDAFLRSTDTQAQVRLDGSDDVLASVAAGTDHVGLLTYDAHARPPGLSQVICRDLRQAPLGIVVPQHHQLANQESVRIDDIRSERFIAFRAGYLMHHMAKRLFGGGSPRTVAHAESTPEVARLVAAGIGVSVLPDFSVAEGDPIVWRPLVDAVDAVTLALVVAPAARGLPQVRKMVSLLEESASIGHNCASASTMVRVSV